MIKFFNMFGIDMVSESRGRFLERLLSESIDTNQFEFIVTPNVNHVVRLEDNDDFMLAYKNSKYRLCDSRILKFLSNIFKHGNDVDLLCYPGSDLTKDLLVAANSIGSYRVAVIGCDDTTFNKVEKQYDNIDFSHLNPSYGFIKNDEEVSRVVDFIIEKKSHLVFFAVGCPQQEMIADIVFSSEKAVGYGLCIGASFDFIGGKIKRAPTIVNALGMEWLFRVACEPKRLFKRYFFDGLRFLKIMVREIVN